MSIALLEAAPDSARLRRYRKTVDRLLDERDQLEDDQVRAMMKLLADVRKSVREELARATADGAQTWQATDLGRLNGAIDRAGNDLLDRYRPQLGESMVRAWEKGSGFAPALASAADPALGLSTNREIALGPLQVAQRVAADLVGQTTADFRRRAKRAIALGVIGRRSPWDVMNDVADLLRTEPDRQTGRLGTIASQAERIQRTEMLGAFNIANEMRHREMAEDVPGLRKYWMTVADARVRPDHATAGARYAPGGTLGPIPVGQDYQVGGELAAFPHDPRLSAANRIQCRCVSIPYNAEWWSEEEIAVSPYPFEPDELVAEPTRLEGAHAKTVYRDAQGRRWLFKPDETPALAEEAGYGVMKRLGLAAPETYVLELKGQTGSIQRMWDDVAGPVRIDGLRGLTPEQLSQVQEHQVVDWLISQHDTNDGALLLGKDGTVRAVDKGQAFKFLGKDRLDWAYNPNPNPLAYNRLFQEYIAGHVDLDVASIEPILAKVEALPEAELAAILRPYGAHAASRGFVATDKHLVDAILARKRTIRADFTAMYARAKQERDRLHPPVPPAVTPIDAELAASVHRQGWAGRSILVAGEDLENGNILAYELHQGSERILVLEMKVRESADAKVLQSISAPATPGPSTHPADSFHDAILPAVKHTVYHLKAGGAGYDGVLTPAKVSGLQSVAKSLQPLKATAADDEMRAMVAHYEKALLDWTGMTDLQSIESATPAALADSIKTAFSEARLLERYVVKPPPTPVTPPSKVPARQEAPWMLAREMDRGVMRTTGARATVTGQRGYTIDLDADTQGSYVAQGDSNRYSKMGRLTIYRRGYQGTAEEITSAVDALGKLGLETRLASRDDVELLYLRKVTHAAKLDVTPEYRAAVLDYLRPETPTSESIRLHRQFWAGRLGVNDLGALPSYDPSPRFDRGYVPATGVMGEPGGWAYWHRFDVTEEAFAREMGDFTLTHRTSGAVDDVVSQLLETNGFMSPTEERQRIGVFRGEGMSPLRDQETGGASYLFTRIHKGAAREAQTITFDPRLLLRTDTVSYGGDYYGEVTPQVKARRQATIDGWKLNAAHSSNETIIKNGFGLLDWVIAIKTNSAAARNRLLKAFKQRGITEVRGKTIEDVVQ